MLTASVRPAWGWLMRHRHQGPPHIACAGCYDEARELWEEARRERFWRVMLVGFAIFLALGSMALLSWRLW